MECVVEGLSVAAHKWRICSEVFQSARAAKAERRRMERDLKLRGLYAAFRVVAVEDAGCAE